MYANLVGTILYPIWSWIFIVHLGWGIYGCAMCDLICMSLTLAIDLGYTYWSEDMQESLVPLNFNELFNF